MILSKPLSSSSSAAWSDTSITVPVPMSAVTGPVVVTVNGISSNSVTFTVLVDALTITYPINSSIINRPDTVVIGRLPSTGNDVGITLNGQIAMVNGQDFAANSVSLTLGENIITATMTDASGNASSTSITVYSNIQDNYVKLSSNIESGLSPLSTELQLDTMLSSTTTETLLAIDGPAPMSPTNVTFPYNLTLQYTGLYFATVTVRAADGTTYEDTLALNVLDMTDIDTLLKAKWNGMKTALINGNVEGGVGYFAEKSRDSFRQQFTLLSSMLAQIASEMGEISLIKVKDNYAEYDLRTVRNNTTYSFQLLFVRDVDGIWRIRSY